MHNSLPFIQDNCREWEMKAIVDSNGKKVKRKQKTLETRKSLSGPGKRKGDSDEEDDYKPTKGAAAKAKKAVESKAKLKPTAVLPSSSAVDFDDDVKPPAPAAKKRAATAKASIKLDPDSDVEMPPQKTAPKRKPKAYMSSDEEDVKLDVKGKAKAKIAEFSSDAEVIPVVAKAKPKAASKRKR